MSRAGNQAGFTLLELLVVLALAGMLMALVPPLLGKGGDRARLDHDRRAVLDCLRQARGDAIVSGRTVAFLIDPDHRLYGVGKPDRSLEAGVELAVEAPLAHPREIHFFADGSASGGLVELANPAGRDRFQIDWLTGRAAAIP
jgi:general secretion pathway protein H